MKQTESFRKFRKLFEKKSKLIFVRFLVAYITDPALILIGVSLCQIAFQTHNKGPQSDPKPPKQKKDKTAAEKNITAVTKNEINTKKIHLSEEQFVTWVRHFQTQTKIRFRKVRQLRQDLGADLGLGLRSERA